MPNNAILKLAVIFVLLTVGCTTSNHDNIIKCVSGYSYKADLCINDLPFEYAEPFTSQQDTAYQDTMCQDTKNQISKNLPETKLFEARAIWVNRWAYRSSSDIIKIIDQIEKANFNIVYFQVRGAFDAYYESSKEPWAKNLTGKSGKHPGFDPLQVAIDHAHIKGIELHAWINVLTLAEKRKKFYRPFAMLNKRGKAYEPQMAYVWASPGVPEVIEHNANVVKDIITHYNVDGIHLDRIRYPNSHMGFNKTSLSRFEKALHDDPGLTLPDWQRNQVTKQVARIYQTIQEFASDVVLSAAVAGIHQDHWNWGNVTEGYTDWLQDWIKWDELKIIDVLIPMVYWPITAKYADYTDFRALVDFYCGLELNRHLYIGGDLLQKADASKQSRMMESFEQISSQVSHSQSSSAEGFVMYDYTTLVRSGYFDKIYRKHFREKAKPPVMPWK